MTPFEYVRGEEEKIKPTASPITFLLHFLIAIMKFVSIFSLSNIALKLELDSFHVQFALVITKIIQLRLIQKASVESNP